jgi:hypothetical protein
MQRWIYLSAATGLICLISWSAPSLAGLIETKVANFSEGGHGLVQKADARFRCTPWSDHIDYNCYNGYGYFGPSPYGPHAYDYPYSYPRAFGLGVPFMGLSFGNDGHYGDRRYWRRYRRHW